MATTTPRIREAARTEVGAFEERYPGYHDELVNALDEIARQQGHMTNARQRQDQVVKLVEKIGNIAVALEGGSSR